MSLVIGNATLSDATCTDVSGEQVAVSIGSEIAMPLAVIAQTYGHGTGHSVLSHVESLLVKAVSTGDLTAAIQVELYFERESGAMSDVFRATGDREPAASP